MLEVREQYTPTGAKQHMNALYRERARLVNARISVMRRRKDEHPSYAGMTDQEFHEYKVDHYRWFTRKVEEVDDQIRKLEKYMEEHKL